MDILLIRPNTVKYDITHPVRFIDIRQIAFLGVLAQGYSVGPVCSNFDGDASRM